MTRKVRDVHPLHEYGEALLDVALKVVDDAPRKDRKKKSMKEDAKRTQASLLRVQALLCEIPEHADTKMKT